MVIFLTNVSQEPGEHTAGYKYDSYVGIKMYGMIDFK